MRLATFGDDSWGFSVLAEHEVELLRGIVSAADPAGCGEAEQRLYQPPMDDPGEADKAFLSDWEDFVSAEFRGEFAAAVAMVEEDLARLEPCAVDLEEVSGDEREAGGKTFSLQIPVAHAESWFSALNQARLVLASRYGLFDGEGEEAVSVSWEGDRPVAAVSAASVNPYSPGERVHACFRSQAFGFIQEWLVANVLSRAL